MEEKKLITENELNANGGGFLLLGSAGPFLGKECSAPAVAAPAVAAPVASALAATSAIPVYIIGAMTDFGPLDSAQTPCF